MTVSAAPSNPSPVPSSTSDMLLPKPLSRRVLSLSTSLSGALPKHVKVTTWGTPLEAAKHVLFYFGGMPASCEEPALHSARGTFETKQTTDIYASRKVHLICIDKPGMGGSSYRYNFQIRRDWPVLVSSVADQLNIDKTVRYGVMGMSNGGPYVMAALTHPTLASRVKAAAMIVGVSDVWESGYFHWHSPSTVFEGLYNSLPQFLTGPLNALGLYAGSLYLFQMGGFQRVFSHLPDSAKEPLRAVLHDAAKTVGLGAALDCQQGLSPLFARTSSNHDVLVRDPRQFGAGAFGRVAP